MKKNTNYVIVVGFEEGQFLEDSYLLGWSCKYDWFDCDTTGDEIMTPTGRVKKNEWGLISINRDVSVYVSDEPDWCREYSDMGKREGYDCTVCKLEKVNDGIILIPV